MNLLPDTFGTTDNLNEADAVLVRSAAMHELELPKSLLAVARAGAGVNNIPLDKCADAGIVVFNTPGANANGVKEIVLAGMLLAARDIRGGMDWVSENNGESQSKICRDGNKGQKTRRNWSWGNRRTDCKRCDPSRHGSDWL